MKIEISWTAEDGYIEERRPQRFIFRSEDHWSGGALPSRREVRTAIGEDLLTDYQAHVTPTLSREIRTLVTEVLAGMELDKDA